jgi:hypothetical protein
MAKNIFTVTVDVNNPSQTEFSKKVTPKFIEKTLNSAITKMNLSGPERSKFTIQVAGGGPFTDWEEYRIWLREMVRRPNDPR